MYTRKSLSSEHAWKSSYNTIIKTKIPKNSRRKLFTSGVRNSSTCFKEEKHHEPSSSEYLNFARRISTKRLQTTWLIRGATMQFVPWPRCGETSLENHGVVRWGKVFTLTDTPMARVGWWGTLALPSRSLTLPSVSVDVVDPFDASFEIADPSWCFCWRCWSFWCFCWRRSPFLVLLLRSLTLPGASIEVANPSWCPCWGR